MKKLFNKLFSILGMFIVLGTLNASAYYIFYDTSTLPSDLKWSQIYVYGFDSNGSLIKDWPTSSGYATLTNAGNIESKYRQASISNTKTIPAYIAFSARYSNQDIDQVIINNGNGTSYAKDTNSSKRNTTKVALVEGGVYSFNTTTGSGYAPTTHGPIDYLLYMYNSGGRILVSQTYTNDIISKATYGPVCSYSGVTATVTNVTKNGSEAISGTDYTLTNGQYQFLKVGTYVFTLGYTGDANGANIISNPITFIITQKDNKVTFGDQQTINFSNSGELTDLGNFFKFQLSSPSLVLNQDYTVAVEPANEGWASVSTYGDLQEALPDDLYTQYLELGTQNVDGLYDVIKGDDIESAYSGSGSGYWYSLKVKFPCSGVYTVTVSPVETSNYTFDKVSTTLTVRPNLSLMYGNGSALNINGYGFSAANTQTINYPFAEGSTTAPYNPENSFVYTPGLYFADALVLEPDWSSADSSSAALIRKAGEAPEPYYGEALSMAGLVTSGTLKATVTKNGATSEPTAFLVLLTDTNFNVSTGIDGVGIDSEEASYYNLQGVKVANPEKGIFVKVEGGKATKIII